MDIYSNILKPMQKENKITFRNLITWNKFHNQKPTAIEMMRSYCVYDEKCLFVMCGTQGFNNNQDNYFEEYEPIRKYLENEAKKAQIDAKKLKEICGVGMFSHWFSKSQWDLMKEEHYKKIQQYCVDNSINAFGVEFGKIKKQYDEIKKQWYDTRAYFDNTHETYMTEVWDFETATEEERENTGGHATPKPIALCSRAIKSSSREGEVVLDVFGGSGSTLIACEQLNRKCYMAELEPRYIDVIINRYINLKGTDKDVFLIRDGQKIPYNEVE
jgi:DNA modification methylase